LSSSIYSFLTHWRHYSLAFSVDLIYLGHFDNTMKANKELFRLEQELEEGYDAETLDSFCKYLYGVVLIKMQQTAKALTVLIESVHQYPYNWSAWLEIASCIPNEESVSAPFSSNILTLSFFFSSRTNLLRFHLCHV